MTPPPDSNQHPLLSILRDLKETTPYAHGALDVLRLLGLVAVEEGNAAPTGAIAELRLASLAAHAADQVTVRFDWNRLAGDGLRGVDIIRAMEEARAARVSNPTPGRTVRVAQAVIKARRAGGDVYLMQYDTEARQYQPIGGKWSAEDASIEAALRREIAEELGLKSPPGQDALALSLLEADWGKTSISPTYGILTRYSFDFFHVTRMSFPITDDADTRWLSRGEIAAGRAGDGRPISQIYVEALGFNRLDGLEPIRAPGEMQG